MQNVKYQQRYLFGKNFGLPDENLANSLRTIKHFSFRSATRARPGGYPRPASNFARRHEQCTRRTRTGRFYRCRNYKDTIVIGWGPLSISRVPALPPPSFTRLATSFQIVFLFPGLSKGRRLSTTRANNCLRNIKVSRTNFPRGFYKRLFQS